MSRKASRVISKSELLSEIQDVRARGVPPEVSNCNFKTVRRFTKEDILSGVHFKECVFPKTLFLEAALDGARFERCDFVEVEIYDSSLHDAVFKDCGSMDVTFGGSDLSNSRFENCDLHNVDFFGAHLHKTRLSRLDFKGSHLAKSDKGKIKQERNNRWARAAEVYRLLKENFASLANHRDASWAHFKEMQMLRKSQRSLGQLISEITWGYGEKPERPLFFGMAVVVFFAAVYWMLGSSCGSITNAETFWDYLMFSGASFVTMSFSDLDATARWAQMLSTLEATAGVITLSMFTFAIGQRISGR